MNIGFFSRHFIGRGADIAVFDYALYNQKLLNNKSYIICFTLEKQINIGFPTERIIYDKFKSEFPILEINDIFEMKDIIKKYDLSFFYTLTYGGENDIYQFKNKDLWENCKTIKHCVFDTTYPESDFYISISNYLNEKYKTNIPVIPHIVNLPDLSDNLKTELNIPKDAIVLGRYGGYNEFNISFVHETIKEILLECDNIYFLFANTVPFYDHPRIIYLEHIIDLKEKVKFINTCDAMIHARIEGETFGLSIGEFSIKNKPIITCDCGDLEHIKILNDKAIIYDSKESLLDIFKNIKKIIITNNNWNAYNDYNPEKIMKLFSNIFNTCISQINGIKFEYFINDAMAQNSIGKNKEWEIHITKFVKLYNSFYNIKNIIDVGANFGYHSLFFSKEVSEKVFSFEPQIQNFNLLKNNIRNNNILNINSYNLACGDTNIDIKMPIVNILPDIIVNMGDFTPNFLINDNYSITKSILLDEMNFPQIDLIKIDVQGWEKKVLTGCYNILKKYKPILIVEFEHFQLSKTNTTCNELFEFIRNNNYYIFYLEHEYPSDHICVHYDNLIDFRNKFEKYIYFHNTDNYINNNIHSNVNEKISFLL